MPLVAHIVDPATARIDPELSAEIGREEHCTLFARPELHDGSFPLLARLGDYDAGAGFSTGELEALIAEVERVAVLGGLDRAIIRFTGPFHSVCCSAFFQGKHVALCADRHPKA